MYSKVNDSSLEGTNQIPAIVSYLSNLSIMKHWAFSKCFQQTLTMSSKRCIYFVTIK